MGYAVKSIFLTLQGEGAHAGRAAVFCRFAGCNLWTGREHHRTSAICRFCDTDFVGTDGDGGGRYGSASALVEAVLSRWAAPIRPFVVLTGGEPTLQIDAELIDRLHAAGAEIAVETNGTRPIRSSIDWICVSPKARAPLEQRHGDELKVPWPQAGLDLDELALLPFKHRWLQPIDSPELEANTAAAVAECIARGDWRLSTQVHKAIGIP